MYSVFKTRLLTTLLFTLLFAVAGKAQVPSAAIDIAFRTGDASGISRYFGPSVDITLNNSTSTYSRTQGEIVLKDFFTKNPVRNYDIEHSGNSTASAATFTIGTLTTSTGRYRVCMWLKPREGGYILKEIRFENKL